MRIYLVGLAVGLVLFVVFLLITLPAGLVVPRILPLHLQQQVRLDGFSGSIWNGNAAIVQVHRFDLGSARWQLSPLKLALMRIDGIFALEREGFFLNGALTSNLKDSLSLRNLQASLLLSDLTAADLLFPGINGGLKFNIESLVFADRIPVAATGLITVSDLHLAWIPGLDLGDYNLTIDHEQQSILIQITDNRGPVNVDLVLRLTPEANRYRYELHGFLQPKPDTEMLLSPALQWMGTPDNIGRYAVQQSGSVSPWTMN